MSSKAGLKRVVKTVHTKKGTKKQTFWVKASPKAAGAKSFKRVKGELAIGTLGALGGATLGSAAGQIAGYGVGRGIDAARGRGQMSVSPITSALGALGGSVYGGVRGWREGTALARRSHR